MAFQRIWHQHYPDGVPKEPDYETITLPEALTRTAERFPENPALNLMGTTISFQELDRLVNRFARALGDLGVGPGDRVAMLLPNIPQVVIANYAAFRIGAVASLNNPMYTERELTHQLNTSEARLLITLDLLHPMAVQLIAQTPVEKIVVCRVEDYLPASMAGPGKEIAPRDDTFMFSELLSRYPDDPVENEAQWDAVGAHLFTGGTTGVSKAVMLTHANMSCNTQQLRAWFPTAEDGQEKSVAIFPFFHSAGFTGVQNLAIYAGWTDILVPRPEPDVIIQVLKNFRPTFFPGVPTIYFGLLGRDAFKSLDLGFVKAFLAGAAPLPTSVVNQLKTLSDAPVVNVYGLTEICPMGTATPFGGPEKPGTVGVPLPGTDLKIMDAETGTKQMDPGEPGEICFKGPQVMPGYYNNPEETAKVLKDGWVYTGDIGYLDEDGYLTLVDRKKDMIIAGGYNIYPNEIDEILYEHPQVVEACTIGIPDEYRGETVKSFIVTKQGADVTEADITAHCKNKLAPYKVPKQIAFVDSLPKSTVGKILRRKLREQETQKA
ncbi:MAG: long-chain fatty acid--CoA ligase [Desulfobacteraceae bacterium]|nr:long-chain fatty acid--CoA ligase [Desulfobacteraceae bacterium]